MRLLYMLIGLPGVGKSFYGKKLSLGNRGILLSSDEIREEIFGFEYNDDIKQAEKALNHKAQGFLLN